MGRGEEGGEGKKGERGRSGEPVYVHGRLGTS